MSPDTHEYAAYGFADIAMLLLWAAACVAVVVFALIQAFRLGVLITSALLDIEENDR